MPYSIADDARSDKERRDPCVYARWLCEFLLVLYVAWLYGVREDATESGWNLKLQMRLIDQLFDSSKFTSPYSLYAFNAAWWSLATGLFVCLRLLSYFRISVVLVQYASPAIIIAGPLAIFGRIGGIPQTLVYDSRWYEVLFVTAILLLLQRITPTIASTIGFAIAIIFHFLYWGWLNAPDLSRDEYISMYFTTQVPLPLFAILSWWVYVRMSRTAI